MSTDEAFFWGMIVGCVVGFFCGASVILLVFLYSETSTMADETPTVDQRPWWQVYQTLITWVVMALVGAAVAGIGAVGGWHGRPNPVPHPVQVTVTPPQGAAGEPKVTVHYPQ